MLRKDSGFTFAELMVVLGIIAIIMALAIPGLIGWIPKHKLGTATRDLLSTLEAARVRAVRERVSVGIEFDVTTYTVFIDNGAGGGNIDNAVRDGSEQIIRNGEMPAGISMTAATFGGNPNFRFNNQGFPIGAGGAPTGGTITVTNTRDTRFVNLSLAGNGSITKP